MPTRYRCGACGNLTRFDVVATTRIRAFWHYTVGGDLQVEDEEVLERHVERVTCRWCAATGPSIEEVAIAPSEPQPSQREPREPAPSEPEPSEPEPREPREG